MMSFILNTRFFINPAKMKPTLATKSRRHKVSSDDFFVSWWLRVSFVLSLFLLLFFSPLPARGEVNLNAYPDRGYPAPEFSLSDLNGKKHALSDYKGKVVLVNVWATWCMPCLVEMPAMESLYGKLKGEKFAMLAVSVDEGGPKAVRKFVEQAKLSFPVLLSPDGSFLGLYMTRSIPTTFIIDKTGTIVSRIPGAREWDSQEAITALQELMNK